MTMAQPWIAAFVLSLTLASGPVNIDPASDAPAEVSLHELFDAYFEERLQRDAVFASEIGDSRYNDRLENFLSDKFRAEEKRSREGWLARIREIDRQALVGQDRWSYDIFVFEQEKALDELEFPRHLLPISQFFSVPSLFVQLGSGEGDHPFRTEKNYRDFLVRIDLWKPLADQIVTNLRQGISRGIVQPRTLMERALPQLERQLVGDPTESSFYQPLIERPKGISEEAFAELRREYRQAIAETIVPSYRRIFEVVRDEYLPACRESVGLSGLPDGAAWYAQLVKAHTTTDLSPNKIHAIGLQEVARIRAEMEEVMRGVGFEGDLPSFQATLRAEERFFATEEEALLDRYRDLSQVVKGALPRLFDFPVEAPFEIRPVPEFWAAAAPAAFYNPGAPDGSRPGTLYVNTHDLPTRPLYLTEALFLHEALPGHHFQSTIARGASDLPRFRRFVLVNAYLEGWAHYSESLGRDLGLYSDPYKKFGRLEAEMLRAARLVVDTGIHAKGWSRERAIEYIMANSSLDADGIAAEVERYIAWPGQALSYKVGELTLQRLRAEAQQRLGARFDVRAFHREVLEDGVLPLNVLERKVGEWLAAQGAAGAKEGRGQ